LGRSATGKKIIHEKMNYELNKEIEKADIVRFIKKQKNTLATSRDADG
jgi:hypothetical protein